MIKITSYGSSSKGNCYLLETDNSSIILDLGVFNEDLLKHIKKIKGVVLTHQHQDHCKGVRELKNYYKGKYYSNKETLQILPVIDELKEIVNDGQPFYIDNFVIVPFELVHDVKCYGYLIKDTISNFKILYATDTGAIDHLRFKDIDCFLIESNCDEDLLTYEDFKEIRVYETHLSMQQTGVFLENNVNHNTKKCILCHISNGEENYLKHKEYIEKHLGENNIEIIALDPHNKEPYEIILKEEIDICFD